ncbi:MAG: GNAT family N-acetyltransferase [Flavobacteriales bacterium]|jgi:RimJ/RimL family protein N-acetyltransferase
MDYPKISGEYQEIEGYRLIPIRMVDRESIRIWRNEQMFHLRQKQALSEDDQNAYFEAVVKPLFTQEYPKQYLFSYVRGEECFGYGGLVHIDYQRGSAELSFIMNTALENEHFSEHWGNFLQLITRIGFHDLSFRKLYTYAYDVRPHLYPVLLEHGWIHERTIQNALEEAGRFIPALIHSKWNAHLRPALPEDIEQTFAWVNDPHIRKHAFQSGSVAWESHKAWFHKKLNDPHCLYFILENPQHDPMGSIRIDQSGSEGTISYLLDPQFHGQGWGSALLSLIVAPCANAGIKTLIGEVLPQNSVSVAIFEKLGYESIKEKDRIRFIKPLYV